MSNLKTLPAAEPAGWYVRTKVTADDREGLILANFGSPEPCHFALFEQGEILAAVASEAINATRETGVGPAEMRRQRDELLEEARLIARLETTEEYEERLEAEGREGEGIDHDDLISTFHKIVHRARELVAKAEGR